MDLIASKLEEYGSPTVWDPDKVFELGELRIQRVPQVHVTGWNNMIKLHNDYVEEGWEGLVIRDPDRPYKPNGRTNDMIKIKVYKDDCFRVIGKEAGLRGSEDMVFIMEMPDGRTFKAKPFGDREQKEEYWNNFEEKYEGHIGECKFFYYSDDGIPLQPSFKAFRDDIE
jgi:DNA ligase-1